MQGNSKPGREQQVKKEEEEEETGIIPSTKRRQPMHISRRSHFHHSHPFPHSQ
jgi:hypothetical protein